MNIIAILLPNMCFTKSNLYGSWQMRCQTKNSILTILVYSQYLLTLLEQNPALRHNFLLGTVRQGSLPSH